MAVRTLIIWEMREESFPTGAAGPWDKEIESCPHRHGETGGVRSFENQAFQKMKFPLWITDFPIYFGTKHVV